jgi:hypothetical protein
MSLWPPEIPRGLPWDWTLLETAVAYPKYGMVLCISFMKHILGRSPKGQGFFSSTPRPNQIWSPSSFICSGHNGGRKGQDVNTKIFPLSVLRVKIYLDGENLRKMDGWFQVITSYVGNSALCREHSVDYFVYSLIFLSARNTSLLDGCLFTLFRRFPYFILQDIHFGFTKPTLLMICMRVVSSIAYVRSFIFCLYTFQPIWIVFRRHTLTWSALKLL